MSYLLLLLSLAGNAMRASVSKIIGRDYVSGGEDARLFNTISGIATSLVLLCVSGFSISMDSRTLLLSAIFGFVYFIAFLSYSKAISLGSMSYTTLFTSLGMIIPIIYSAIFMGETPMPLQIAGLIVLIISLVIMNTGGKKEKWSFAWIVWVLLSFLASGSISLIQKISSLGAVEENRLGFLSVTFAFYTLFSALSLVFYREKLAFSVRRILLSASQGLCDALQHSLNFILASMLPSIVLFPVLGGGAALIAVVIAMLFFHEKLSSREKLSVLLIVLSLVLLSMP